MRFPGFLKSKPTVVGRQITLPEAVRQGLVTFQVRGTGEGVTSSVELQLIKLTPEPLTITVPRGTEFVPFQRL
jgi:hypothetical protein